MRTEIDQLWNSLSRAAKDFEDSTREIREILGDSDSPKGYALVSKLSPLFELRLRAMHDLVIAESKLQGVASQGFDFGYSHENNHSIESGYSPIQSSNGGSPWYPSVQEAILAKLNDLRWTVPTFLVSRPTPSAPQRIDQLGRV